MRRSIRYGEQTIVFTVRYLPRSRRSVTIHVLPDGLVQVEAPEAVSVEAVVAAVRQRARWILQQLASHRERLRHVLAREYVSGESHFYLGKRHLLKVMRSDKAPPEVKLRGGRLEVMTHVTDADTVRQLLEGWYRQRAQEVFARRIADHTSRAGWLKEAPAFRLLNMRTQWGSCSPKGMLVLNPQLVKAPRACVDYVICHELCHLKMHDHSPRYYRLLEMLMPDWEKRKQELDEMAELLLNW